MYALLSTNAFLNFLFVFYLFILFLIHAAFCTEKKIFCMSSLTLLVQEYAQPEPQKFIFFGPNTILNRPVVG